MSVEDTINAYLKLSKEVFTPKHKFNILATLINIANAKGRYDSQALKESIKEIVTKELGEDHKEALLLESEFVCRVYVFKFII